MLAHIIIALFIIVIIHLLGPEATEQEQEVLVEPSPVEDVTNSFPKKGKPRCIPPIILAFYFLSLLATKFDYGLSL
jgi:hypothetical protein